MSNWLGFNKFINSKRKAKLFGKGNKFVLKYCEHNLKWGPIYTDIQSRDEFLVLCYKYDFNTSRKIWTGHKHALTERQNDSYLTPHPSIFMLGYKNGMDLTQICV